MVKAINGASGAGTMPASEMAAILGRILQRHGVAVLEDRRRTLGLLRDHAPSETRAVRLLMTAFDMDVPKHLASEDGAPAQVKIEQEIHSLVADSGLQADLARWAVDVWSGALSAATPGKAAPAPVAPPAAPAPSAESLTWGSASGKAAASAAVAPAAPASSAESLTWGDETPVQVAPAAAPAAAPRVAPPPAAPAAGAAGMAQNPLVRYALIAAVVIGAGFGIKTYMEQPTPVPPTPPSPPGPAPQPPQPTVTIASTSENVNDWPTFPGAAHPNGNPNAWQFQFNLRFADARILAYNVFVAMDSGGRSGSGSMRALDTRYLNGGAEMVSSTPTLAVTREIEPSSKIYITHITATSWDKNPSRAQNICVIFSTGNLLLTFNPDSGVFCAFELQGGTCSSQKIGCGKL